MKKIILGAVAMFALLILAAIARNATYSEVRNVIVLVGDGMGLAHVSYTDECSDEPLFIDRVDKIGLVRTHSASHRVTDSAASATAFACGEKTDNGMIGVDPYRRPLKSILERVEELGYATGIVATYSVTHATPAGYLAHNKTRNDHDGIAKDVVASGVDVVIAGGRKFFEERADSLDLSADLRRKGYEVLYDMESVEAHKRGQLMALLADNGLPTMLNGRGDMLPRATDKVLNLLSDMSDDKGFFVMIEGSQIDGEAHANNAEGVVAETLDFDAAVKIALDFADEHPQTLVLIFADHETGGLTMPADNGIEIEPTFSSKKHTGIMVPIYAYGAGADNFTGVMDNTEIPSRIANLIGLK